MGRTAATVQKNSMFFQCNSGSILQWQNPCKECRYCARKLRESKIIRHSSSLISNQYSSGRIPARCAEIGTGALIVHLFVCCRKCVGLLQRTAGWNLACQNKALGPTKAITAFAKTLGFSLFICSWAVAAHSWLEFGTPKQSTGAKEG